MLSRAPYVGNPATLRPYAAVSGTLRPGGTSAKSAVNIWTDTLTVLDISIPGTGYTTHLLMRPDGGPVRAIPAGRQCKPVGRYYSQKCGKFQPYESKNELHAFWHVEVDSRVVEYLAQPHTLIFYNSGKQERYTPDRADQLAGNNYQITEIKSAYRAERDPLYAAKLDRAALHYKTLGWDFQVVTSSSIEAEPLFKLTEAIQTYRRVSITHDDIVAVRQLFGDGVEAPFAKVRDLFKCAPLGFAKVSAMVVRRLVEIDLSNGLHDFTPLRRLRL